MAEIGRTPFDQWDEMVTPEKQITPSFQPTKFSFPLFRIGMGFLVLGSLVVCLNILFSVFGSCFEEQLAPLYREWGTVTLILAAGALFLLLVIPFVPGMEIGLALMMVFGAKGVAVVYVTTVLALSFSFLIGKLVPFRFVVWFLGCLHFHRAKRFAARISSLEQVERLELMMEHAPVKAIPYLLKHRYVALAILLNIPGNSIIGGGGGIGLLAGLSNIYQYPKYLLMVSLAITPIPLLFLANIHFMSDFPF